MAGKKIIYLITKGNWGGAQKYVADLASHLDPRRFDARIMRGGVDIPHLSNKISPQTLFLNDWLAIFELFRTYRREAPAIIHLNSSKASVIGSFAAGIYNLSLVISRKSLVKVIFTAHGWVFNPLNKLSSSTRFFYTLLHRIAALFQDAIICVSAYDRALALTRHIAPARKLYAVLNGIDYENLKFLDKVSARKKILETLYPSGKAGSPAGPDGALRHGSAGKP